MTRGQIATSIKLGIELLNREVPDWEGYIDRRYLDLEDTRCCILGQLERRGALRGRISGPEFVGWDPYFRAGNRLGLLTLENGELARDGVERAIALGFDAEDERYGQLTADWLTYLAGDAPVRS